MKLSLSFIFLFIGTLCCSCAADSISDPPFVREVIEIRIPRIKIETASAMEVFSFIEQRVLEFDPNPAVRGICFFTVGDVPSADRAVNYHKDNVPVGLLLQDVADLLYGVDVHITSAGARSAMRWHARHVQ